MNKKTHSKFHLKHEVRTTRRGHWALVTRARVVNAQRVFIIEKKQNNGGRSGLKEFGGYFLLDYGLRAPGRLPDG